VSRHFYLPPHKPIGRAAGLKQRLGSVPLWLSVALPTAVALASAVIVLDALGIWPQRSPTGPRHDAGRVVAVDTAAQPADSGSRLIEESVPTKGEAAVAQPERAIRLQVLNGCGVKGLARIVSPALRAKGFDVRETRNAGSFRYTRSMVLDRVGRPELAYAVADSLGIDRSQVTTEISRNLVDIDVTLIVGADYGSLGLGATR
jgi:hypothetical protein